MIGIRSHTPVPLTWIVAFKRPHFGYAPGRRWEALVQCLPGFPALLSYQSSLGTLLWQRAKPIPISFARLAAARKIQVNLLPDFVQPEF